MQTPTWLLVLFLGAAALLLVVLIVYVVFQRSFVRAEDFEHQGDFRRRTGQEPHHSGYPLAQHAPTTPTKASASAAMTSELHATTPR